MGLAIVAAQRILGRHVEGAEGDATCSRAPLRITEFDRVEVPLGRDLDQQAVRDEPTDSGLQELLEPAPKLRIGIQLRVVCCERGQARVIDHDRDGVRVGSGEGRPEDPRSRDAEALPNRHCLRLTLQEFVQLTWLDFEQDDVSFLGHAIECRITSEHPDSGFLPATGCIHHLEVPSGPGVRWDGGIRVGSDIGLHYDPLMGKLIVHADSRPTAIARMKRALGELVIHGVETSVPFHLSVMEEEDFANGDYTITYVEEHPEVLRPSDGEVRLAALLAALLEDGGWGRTGAARIDGRDERNLSTWQAAGWPWRTSDRRWPT